MNLFTVALCAACFGVLVGCSTPAQRTVVTNGVPNLHEFAPGIWRSGQPINPEAWRYLRSIGVRKVVKLNPESEASDAGARAAGLPVFYFPISFSDQTIGIPSPSLINAAVAEIEPGTLLHCSHGQDRSGLIVGAYRVKKQGWNKGDAYREMQAFGFHPELRGLVWAWDELK